MLDTSPAPPHAFLDVLGAGKILDNLGFLWGEMASGTQFSHEQEKEGADVPGDGKKGGINPPCSANVCPFVQNTQ